MNLEPIQCAARPIQPVRPMVVRSPTLLNMLEEAMGPSPAGWYGSCTTGAAADEASREEAVRIRDDVTARGQIVGQATRWIGLLDQMRAAGLIATGEDDYKAVIAAIDVLKRRYEGPKEPEFTEFLKRQWQACIDAAKVTGFEGDVRHDLPDWIRDRAAKASGWELLIEALLRMGMPAKGRAQTAEEVAGWVRELQERAAENKGPPSHALSAAARLRGQLDRDGGQALADLRAVVEWVFNYNNDKPRES